MVLIIETAKGLSRIKATGIVPRLIIIAPGKLERPYSAKMKLAKEFPNTEIIIAHTTIWK